ncbi:hypothetical protein B0H11DRAFT_1927750 [Mycena galericulata]|nr:hypothetical protein B0H11DRAFT_1927750 [Mycena galericulata]
MNDERGYWIWNEDKGQSRESRHWTVEIRRAPPFCSRAPACKTYCSIVCSLLSSTDNGTSQRQRSATFTFYSSSKLYGGITKESFARARKFGFSNAAVWVPNSRGAEHAVRAEYVDGIKASKSRAGILKKACLRGGVKSLQGGNESKCRPPYIRPKSLLYYGPPGLNQESPTSIIDGQLLNMPCKLDSGGY